MLGFICLKSITLHDVVFITVLLVFPMHVFVFIFLAVRYLAAVNAELQKAPELTLVRR
jgi:hypothetical protein